MSRNGVKRETNDSFDFQLPIMQHSRHISRLSGDLAYNTHLTALGKDETDIDQNLMAVARNLGIEIPEEPIDTETETLSPNVSKVTVTSAHNDASISQSRYSDSTIPTSISTVDEIVPESVKLIHTLIQSLMPTHVPIESLMAAETPLPPSRAPSVVPSRAPHSVPTRTTSYSKTPSIASSTVAESETSTERSVFSMSTKSKHSSMASSFTKTLRRISGFSKRKVAHPVYVEQAYRDQAYIEPALCSIPLFVPGESKTVSTPALVRPSSAGGLPPQLDRSESAITAPVIRSAVDTASRKAVGTVLPSCADTHGSRISLRRPLSSTIEEENLEQMRLAQDRSLRNSHLQRLRTAQLEEQARLIHELLSKSRKAKAEATTKLRTAKEAYEKRRDETIDQHESANSELEMRHLTAELELEELLTSQRRACETKLKHMEAYCYGKRDGAAEVVPQDETKYPRRAVTEEDYRKLVQHYHLRNGMYTLHKSKIHVLREQQAQQVARIFSRQKEELDALRAHHTRDYARLQIEANRAESELRREYHNNKSHMLWRWKVKEAIIRRRLELERGQVFGELPDINWPEEQKERDDMIMLALGKGERISLIS